MDLTAEEQRVLGCLIEKSMLTPDVYPLTLNSLLTACNQTTSREPVVDYDAETAKGALDHLRMRHRYVRVELPRPGSRVEKYKHDLVTQLQLSNAELAILAVMLLRGPQTVNELRTRTERIHNFASLAELESTIDQLCDPTRDCETPVTASSGQLQPQPGDGDSARPANYRRPWNGPLAIRLERVTGQKEPRIGQLLGGPIDLELLTQHGSSGAPSGGGGARSERVEALETTVGQLRADLDELRAEFERFKSQF